MSVISLSFPRSKVRLQVLTICATEINSSFVEISLHLFFDPAHPLASTLRPLLPIYLDSFFSLPVTRADGTQLAFEEVVRTLDAETLSYSIDTGRPLAEDITVKIKVTRPKYATAIAWLNDVLYGSQFSIDRYVTFVSFQTKQCCCSLCPVVDQAQDICHQSAAELAGREARRIRRVVQRLSSAGHGSREVRTSNLAAQHSTLTRVSPQYERSYQPSAPRRLFAPLSCPT